MESVEALSPQRCVCTLYDDRSLSEWGHLAVARTTQWAVRHNFKLIIRPFCDAIVGTWCIPRRVLEVLEEGECSEVLFLDGDAVVSRLDWAPPNPHRPLTMAIHDETVAGCSLGCVVNSGVFIVQNNAVSRGLMHWWVAFGNRSCSKHVSFPEQACAERLRRRWPQYMDVLGYRAMNTPVKITRSLSPQALAACMADRRNGICHPLGVRFFCKHHEHSVNATARCMSQIRHQMFSILSTLP